MYYEICVSFIVDVDECLSPNACGSEHVCNNTAGSYACECPLGYVADSGLQNPLDPVCVGEEFYIIFYLTHTAAVCYTVCSSESHNSFSSDAPAKLWRAFNLKPVLQVANSCVLLQQAEEKENAGVHSELRCKAATISCRKS